MLCLRSYGSADAVTSAAEANFGSVVSADVFQCSAWVLHAPRLHTVASAIIRRPEAACSTRFSLATTALSGPSTLSAVHALRGLVSAGLPEPTLPCGLNDTLNSRSTLGLKHARNVRPTFVAAT
jgi:hypothetical protein